MTFLPVIVRIKIKTVNLIISLTNLKTIVQNFTFIDNFMLRDFDVEHRLCGMD